MEVGVPNRTSCGLIGGRALRLVAPSGHVDYRGEPRVETRTQGVKRTKKFHRPPSIFEIMILSLLYQPLKYKHTIPLSRRRRRRRRRRCCPVACFLFFSLLHPLSILVVLRFTTVRVTTDY